MHHADARKIFLDPGHFVFAEPGTHIHTLLGSCVAITMWHPKLQIIAIYAKKFNFKPKLIPATTFGGEDGMIAIVNISLVYTTYFYKIISIHSLGAKEGDRAWTGTNFYLGP